MASSAKDIVFDVEQLLFARLRDGASKLGMPVMKNMTSLEIHRWLALPIYSSMFRTCPSVRTDKMAPVNLYDECIKVIASIEVNYVVSMPEGTHFSSVPVVISDGKEVPGDAIKAVQFLNISLHQSQVVTSPGFVVVYHNKESIEVASYGGDGKEMRKMIVEG